MATSVYSVSHSNGTVVFCATLKAARAEAALDADPLSVLMERCFLRDDLSPRELAVAMLNGSGWSSDSVEIEHLSARRVAELRARRESDE